MDGGERYLKSSPFVVLVASDGWHFEIECRD